MTMPHGTYSRYVDSGCRCAECREALRKRQGTNNEARRSRPKDPGDPRHGSDNFYTNHGCRCERCKEAHKEKCALHYQARKAARTA